MSGHTSGGSPSVALTCSMAFDVIFLLRVPPISAPIPNGRDLATMLVAARLRILLSAIEASWLLTCPTAGWLKDLNRKTLPLPNTVAMASFADDPLIASKTSAVRSL